MTDFTSSSVQALRVMVTSLRKVAWFLLFGMGVVGP